MNEIQIIGSNRSMRYVDQLSKDKQSFNCRFFKKHILETYQLSLQQYYNIIVHDDVNYSQKCKHCKKKNVYFIRLIDGYRDFCSVSCQSKFVSSSDGNKELAAKTIANTNRKKWVQKCNDKNLRIAYLYILISEHKFKVGVTIYPQRRSDKMSKNIDVISKSIYQSSPQNVANVEQDILHQFEHKHEWIDIQHYEAAMKIIDSSTLLNFYK